MNYNHLLLLFCYKSDTDDYLALIQISIYGVVCSICFANLSIQEQKAKPKIDGLKILDSQSVIIWLDGMQPVLECRHGRKLITK